MTEAHVSEQLAQGCYLAVHRTGIEPATSGSDALMLRYQAREANIRK